MEDNPLLPSPLTRPLYLDQMLTRPDKSERIVIVGAGIFGLSTAYHLLNRGYTNVTILDRAETLPAEDAASSDLNKGGSSYLHSTYYFPSPPFPEYLYLVPQSFARHTKTSSMLNWPRELLTNGLTTKTGKECIMSEYFAIHSHGLYPQLSGAWSCVSPLGVTFPRIENVHYLEIITYFILFPHSSSFLHFEFIKDTF